MKERKTIFAYEKRECGKYCYLSAISADKSKQCHFTVDWNNYKQSIKEMLSAFEKFCLEECGFYDGAYCNVWFTKSAYERSLHKFLSRVDWCCVNYIEHSFHLFGAHTTYTDFEDFKKAQGYDEQAEPFATKSLFAAYKTFIDTQDFSPEEKTRMKKYFYRNFSMIEEKEWYDYDLALAYVAARFRLLDKNSFCELLKYACEVYQAKIKRKEFMYRFCESILEAYHELYDYDDWIYCSRHGNDDKPLLAKKYAGVLFGDCRLNKIREIIEEQERKYDEARMQMGLALQRAIKI